MKSKAIVFIVLGLVSTALLFGQTPAPARGGAAPGAQPQGPGVQAPADPRYAEWIMSKCKTPPPQRGGGRGPAPAGAARGEGGGAGRGDAARGAVDPNSPPAKRDYKVTEIPGVIAAGQQWKSIWTGTGNNADGILATKDGGILAAQNTNSQVMQIDKNGKVSFPYKDTNTGGALSMNKKGDLFIVERGLPEGVWQLAPKRRLVANMYNGEPFECIGGTINDLTADSKGGVYFTMGGLFYINPQGMVTRYGENLNTNGIVLSADEKKLYVTTRGLVVFDVQPDGALTNQKQFIELPNNADGTTIDAMGRVYTTTADGVNVISPEGKLLGTIPTPLNFITVAFSGPDKKTLYGVANNQRFDEIFTIQMLAQGYKGRPK